MCPDFAPARPGSRAAGKLHLRLVDINRRTYRVASLRPNCGVAFSTNNYHQTRHVISDPVGAAVLARLLWGLAFQKRPGTLVCIYGPHLQPTPFDADHSAPVVLVPTGLTPVVTDDLRVLRKHLRRPSRVGTRICWPSFGLDRALDDSRSFWQLTPGEQWRRRRDNDLLEVRLVGSCVVIAGPPEALRSAALGVHRLSKEGGYDRQERLYPDGGQNYLYLGCRGSAYPEGEVQVFGRYRAMLSEAAEARRRTLGADDAPREHEALLNVIGLRREAVCKERQASRSGPRQESGATDPCSNARVRGVRGPSWGRRGARKAKEPTRW